MLQCSFLFIVKEIIIFMTSCKLVIGNYKGLYNANIWMSTALWGISGNVHFASAARGAYITFTEAVGEEGEIIRQGRKIRYSSIE